MDESIEITWDPRNKPEHGLPEAPDEGHWPRILDEMPALTWNPLAAFNRAWQQGVWNPLIPDHLLPCNVQRVQDSYVITIDTEHSPDEWRKVEEPEVRIMQRQSTALRQLSYMERRLRRELEQAAAEIVQEITNKLWPSSLGLDCDPPSPTSGPKSVKE